MKMKTLLNNRKGVAGLTVLLTVIVMLFMIGFLVGIFAILGGELEDETWDESTTLTITRASTTGVMNETGTTLNTTVNYRDTIYRSCSISITQCANASGNTPGFSTGNWTTSGCTITYAGALAAGGVNNSYWTGCNGTLTYTANTTASLVIGDASDELAEVTDWFGIIIVISAMVVLILLTTIIIRAISGGDMGVFKGSSSVKESA